MNYDKINYDLKSVQRMPKESGYKSGYRIPNLLDQKIVMMADDTGLSKTHCLEIIIATYFSRIASVRTEE